jgi:hypothetical protein
MKIADFGLARHTRDMDYYRKTTDVSNEAWFFIFPDFMISYYIYTVQYPAVYGSPERENISDWLYFCNISGTPPSQMARNRSIVW